MNSPLVWILGRGGLLGSRFSAALAARWPGAEIWNCPMTPFAWSDPTRIGNQITLAARLFRDRLQTADRSAIVSWMAGSGSVSSTTDSLERERDCWEAILAALERHIRPDADLHLFLASSAGGVYGGSAEELLSESSPSLAISAYGRHKLALEKMVLDWTRDRNRVRLLIGRISNLYGPGQNLAKPQGLISHLSRSIIHRQPIHLYVPLDTIRDYLYVEDAAALIVEGMKRLQDRADPSPVIKIFASEQSHTVSHILAEMRHLTRKQPRLICAPIPLRHQQPQKLRFRSEVWTDLNIGPLTELRVGIDRVHREQLSLFRRGLLPPVNKAA